MGVINLDHFEKKEVKFEFRGKTYNVANDLKTALKIMNEFSTEQAKEGAIQDIDAEMAKVDEVIKVAISNYDPELLELTIAGKNTLLMNIMSVATGLTMEQIEQEAERNFTRAQLSATNTAGKQ